MKYELISEVTELAGIEARDWKRMLDAIHSGNDPHALLGGIAGQEGNIPSGALPAVTGGTANVKWWDGLIYSPIFAGLQAPKTFECFAEGTVTSSAGSQTLILNPTISTGAVGTGLTASPTQTLGTTITNAIWSLTANITVRTAGTGTGATAVGSFHFEYTTVANGGAPTTVIWRSSGGAVTFDSSVLNAFVFGATPSAAGVSVTPQAIRWGSWN